MAWKVKEIFNLFQFRKRGMYENMTNELWKQLGDEMGRSKESCKCKWSHLGGDYDTWKGTLDETKLAELVALEMQELSDRDNDADEMSSNGDATVRGEYEDDPAASSERVSTRRPVTAAGLVLGRHTTAVSERKRKKQDDDDDESPWSSEEENIAPSSRGAPAWREEMRKAIEMLRVKEAGAEERLDKLEAALREVIDQVHVKERKLLQQNDSLLQELKKTKIAAGNPSSRFLRKLYKGSCNHGMKKIY